MNRWTVRIIGLLLLLVFGMLFLNLERQLLKLQERQRHAPPKIIR
jgi:uncharacterized membrane-anchored protein YhcB (DUF1043 family)